MHTYIYIYTYVHIYVHTYIYIYIHIHIYIHMWARQHDALALPEPPGLVLGGTTANFQTKNL